MNNRFLPQTVPEKQLCPIALFSERGSRKTCYVFFFVLLSAWVSVKCACVCGSQFHFLLPTRRIVWAVA